VLKLLGRDANELRRRGGEKFAGAVAHGSFRKQQILATPDALTLGAKRTLFD
jgi:hypothetical protein